MDNEKTEQMKEETDYDRKVRFLRQYQSAYARCVGLEHERQKWIDLSLRINQQYDTVGSGGSGNNSKVEMGQVSAVDILAQIDAEIKTATELRESVKNAVKRLKNDYHVGILELHYINGLPLWKIAQVMKKTEKTIKSVHKTAVNLIELPQTEKAAD